MRRLTLEEPGAYIKNKRDTIVERIKINAFIWIAISIIQIFLGICLNMFILIVGTINLYSAFSDLDYAKAYAKNSVGIIKKVKPVGEIIFMFIYNLAFGGGVGVFGIIFYLAYVRNYVLRNENIFLEIEKQYSSLKK